MFNHVTAKVGEPDRPGPDPDFSHIKRKDPDVEAKEDEQHRLPTMDSLGQCI